LIFIATDTNAALQNDFINYFYEFFSLEDQNELIFAAAITTISVILIGGTFSIISVLALSKFATSSGVILGNKLLEGYIYLSWQELTKRTDSKIINEIYQESSRVTQNILVPFLMLNKNLILTIFIIIGLTIVDPIMTIIFFLFLCGTYIVIYLFFRAQLYNNSEKLTSAHEKRLSFLSDIFKLFKQIKIWNIEKTFLTGFNEASNLWGRIYKQNLNIALLPRYFVEVIILVGCCIGILTVFTQGNGIENTIPKISIFAFSAFKLLPAIQGMYYSTSQIRGNIFSLSSIIKTINSFNKKYTKSDEIEQIKKIELQDISFSYKKSNFSLRNINLTVSNNTLIGITGTSGSGKSTFINILLGLLKQDNGMIKINGVEKTLFENNAWFKKISYAPPNVFFTSDSLESNIYLYKSSSKVFEELSSFSNLDFLSAANLNEGFSADDFSEGQMQRIGLARAFAKEDSNILIFDEPTSSLDVLNRNLILKNLMKLANEKIIFVITHDLEILRECNQILIFNNGKLEIFSDYGDASMNSIDLKNLIDAKNKED